MFKALGLNDSEVQEKFGFLIEAFKFDTGIEISFPSEYAADANYIEFMADAQGRVSILIKNVGSIENR